MYFELLVGVPGDLDEHVQKDTSKAHSRKPKPMYFKRKRGIVPYRLFQMRLSNFIHSFPNLQPSGAVTMGGGLTNDRGGGKSKSYFIQSEGWDFGKQEKVGPRLNC